MARRITKRGLIKKLDKVYSLWVRTKDADSNGMVKCYTCDKVAHWKEMHCGHFISRVNYVLRWEPDNTRVQCPSCNLFKSGNQYEFGKRLEKEIGQGRIDQMMEIKHNPSLFNQQDYIDMISHYEELLSAESF